MDCPNLQKTEFSHLLSLDVDPLRSLEMNPCASSDPSQGTQKPDTSASRCALRPVTCQANPSTITGNPDETK